jgi:N-ethylmaleimide reductase
MDLFSQYELGDIHLLNRMVMAPMTRCRAIEENVPNPLAVTYYTQRSQAGLIITEGSQVSPQGAGYFALLGSILLGRLLGGGR